MLVQSLMKKVVATCTKWILTTKAIRLIRTRLSAVMVRDLQKVSVAAGASVVGIIVIECFP